MIAIDSVPDRLEIAGRFGAQPVHLTEDDPRAAVKRPPTAVGWTWQWTQWGTPKALELACRLARKAGAASRHPRRLRGAHPAAHGDHLDQGR